MLGISDSSKKESPCYHRLVSLQIDSRPSQVVTHQKPGKSDVALQNKSSPKSHIQPVLLGISDSSKKESPCYHRLVSLQIDSRPSQVVTHQKPGKSDVALQNKSPQKSHIKVILLGISDSSKKESPCYHRLVSLQIDSRPSQVVTHQNQASLMLHYKIKALQNLISNLFCLAFQIALKGKSLLPQTSFTSDL